MKNKNNFKTFAQDKVFTKIDFIEIRESGFF